MTRGGAKQPKNNADVRGDSYAPSAEVRSTEASTYSPEGSVFVSPDLFTTLHFPWCDKMKFKKKLNRKKCAMFLISPVGG